MAKYPSYTREETEIALRTTNSNHPDWKEDPDAKNKPYTQDTEAGSADELPPYEAGEAVLISEAKELVTAVIHVEDDPTQNPWTFRMFFLGILL
jgi:hypothetical protein